MDTGEAEPMEDIDGILDIDLRGPVQSPEECLIEPPLMCTDEGAHARAAFHAAYGILDLLLRDLP